MALAYCALARAPWKAKHTFSVNTKHKYSVESNCTLTSECLSSAVPMDNNWYSVSLHHPEHSLIMSLSRPCCPKESWHAMLLLKPFAWNQVSQVIQEHVLKCNTWVVPSYIDADKASAVRYRVCVRVIIPWWPTGDPCGLGGILWHAGGQTEYIPLNV